MPMKMPFGPEWFKSINWNIPKAVPRPSPADGARMCLTFPFDPAARAAAH